MGCRKCEGCNRISGASELGGIMRWNPTVEQQKYLDLVLSMTTDCLRGKGTDTVLTYLRNLETIIDQIPQPPPVDDADDAKKGG